MNKFHLSASEKTHLETLHEKTVEGKKRDRIKAVLLRSEDWRISDIAQALRIHEATVTRHLKDYREGKLTPSNGGSNSKLTAEQTQALVTHLTEHLYHHTCEIVNYIGQTYQVTYSVPGMNKWLHQNGFSYKKPKGRPNKADHEEQAVFIKQYNVLKEGLGANEAIIFMDSVHPTQNTKLAYGWIKTGEDKRIHTTASRTRVNLVGAIELGHLSETLTERYDTINGDNMVDFLKKLRDSRKHLSTLHLILDQAGYHKADIVKQAAAEYHIKLHYLPPYSPNLNPIERLWKVMNERVRNNKFFNSATEFRDNIEGFFKQILPDIADSLNSRINDNFQTL